MVSWYRSPIIWLAAALLVATIAGCVVTILVAVGQPADAVPGVGDTVFRVPIAHAAP